MVIPRSYQETLQGEFGSIEAALDGVDPEWKQRDLVIFPSHISPSDCSEMIRLAHRYGFDAVALPFLLSPTELPKLSNCLALPWNVRWTISNDRRSKPEGQIEALGHDLWSWIAAAIENR
ncbi:MAG: hypothetical protein C4K60_06275 [Ideonella sp. MAG2]|nr:MAG: hypothetical protein C4K60_06275 [Ideonella sp. MAG2]